MYRVFKEQVTNQKYEKIAFTDLTKVKFNREA